MADSSCCACGASLEKVLDLGSTPLADELFPTREASLQARRFPLQVGHCEACGWAQLLQVPAREILFAEDYPYFSSVSEGVSRSAEQHARELIQERGLGPDHHVIEIASNDGYQLKWFHEAGIRTLGIDPVPVQNAQAQARGIQTRKAFFDSELAKEIAWQEGPADIILAKNVLAHVTDPRDFLTGIACLLKEDGMASFEFPYLANLLRDNQFDTIYHEHASYLAIKPLDRLLELCGLGIVSIKTNKLHGGSLRVDVKKGHDPANPDRKRYLQLEENSGINTAAAWEQFSRLVNDVSLAVVAAVSEQRQQGRSMAAYGAAAKGVTLMNVCGLTDKDIDFVVDRNEYKVGKFMAGTGMEIRPCEQLLQSRPDGVLLLAWNFAAEIRQQQQSYEAAGGRFLVPVPWPKWLGRNETE